MGRNELISDPRFSTVLARKAHEEEVDKRWPRDIGLGQRKSSSCFRKRVKAGFVETMEDMFKDPQLKHRGSLPAGPSGSGRYHARAAVCLSKTPFKMTGRSHDREHNELVSRNSWPGERGIRQAGKRRRDFIKDQTLTLPDSGIRE